MVPLGPWRLLLCLDDNLGQAFKVINGQARVVRRRRVPTAGSRTAAAWAIRFLSDRISRPKECLSRDGGQVQVPM